MTGNGCPICAGDQRRQKRITSQPVYRCRAVIANEFAPARRLSAGRTGMSCPQPDGIGIVIDAPAFELGDHLCTQQQDDGGDLQADQGYDHGRQ
jgi:hypothetical protein